MTETPSWLDELDLDPHAEPVSMGVRTLADRPWLVRDERAGEELRLKERLCSERHEEVFAAESSALGPSEVVHALLVDHGVAVVDVADLHPLDRAGRSVQEDLCVMQRRSHGWYLTAASLCFPSRWRLRDKIGRHVTEVHGPVHGYDQRLASKVDTFFDRLSASPVWRRNWFVHPDASLFQPDRPAEGDPVIRADQAIDMLVVRSERQTLRRLDPVDDAILFTIRVQQATLRELLVNRERGERFRRLLASAPSETLAHRGMRPEQVLEIQEALRA
ncbi:MAG: DUF3445 domain-containing protein [Actinomycetota bacterium]